MVTHEVSLSVTCPDEALAHVLDALHREGHFMHEVGLIAQFSIRSARSADSE